MIDAQLDDRNVIESNDVYSIREGAFIPGVEDSISCMVFELFQVSGLAPCPV